MKSSTLLLSLIRLITFFVNVIDLIISAIRRRNSNVLRFALIKYLSVTRLMNQNFVTQTFLEKNRVIERFKIENDLKDFIDKNSSTETIFWDIGACVGNFSIYAGAKLCKVYAFEPDGLTYSSLITNIYNSNLLNIKAYPIALGNDSKISDFNMQEFKIANAYNSADTKSGPTGKRFKPQYTQMYVCLQQKN